MSFSVQTASDARYRFRPNAFSLSLNVFSLPFCLAGKSFVSTVMAFSKPVTNAVVSSPPDDRKIYASQWKYSPCRGHHAFCRAGSHRTGEAMPSETRRVSDRYETPPLLQMTIQKTRLCAYLTKSGICKKTNCLFAHSSAELRERPDLTRTKLCLSFSATGVCQEGESCRFAHGSHELRHTKEFYKTALCSLWKLNHICKIGDKCRFAHGLHELRPQPGLNRHALPHLGRRRAPPERRRIFSDRLTASDGEEYSEPKSTVDQAGQQTCTTATSEASDVFFPRDLSSSPSNTSMEFPGPIDTPRHPAYGNPSLYPRQVPACGGCPECCCASYESVASYAQQVYQKVDRTGGDFRESFLKQPQSTTHVYSVRYEE